MGRTVEANTGWWFYGVNARGENHRGDQQPGEGGGSTS